MFSDFYTVDLRDLWGRLGLPRRALRLHFCSFWELLGSPTEAVWGHRVSLGPLGGFMGLQFPLGVRNSPANYKKGRVLSPTSAILLGTKLG